MRRYASLRMGSERPDEWMYRRLVIRSGSVKGVGVAQVAHGAEPVKAECEASKNAGRLRFETHDANDHAYESVERRDADQWTAWSPSTTTSPVVQPRPGARIPGDGHENCKETGRLNEGASTLTSRS